MSATIVILLCALACPLSMALMTIFMRKEHGESRRERSDRSDGARDGRDD
jgi:hypothetical protein